MKILYDHQIFYRQNYGGVSRYFCELMNQYSLDPDMSFILPLRYVQNDNLKQFPHLDKYWSNRYNSLYNNHFISSIGKKIRFNAVNFGLNYLINNQSESVHLLKKQDFDIFHPTYYEPYFLKYLQKKPYVLTVYDMTHELFPKYFKTPEKIKSQKKFLIEQAGAVIAISENTKRDILKFTDIDPDRVHVVYLGNPLEHQINNPSFNAVVEQTEYGTDYLLFVGGRSGYKNFNFFIESVSKLLHADGGLHVVCAGTEPFNDNEKKLLKSLGVQNRVHHMKINDSSLITLYKNARAFVFPSIYEGFGLPILEAFSCGCPVVLNNSSSLPEIGGDGALYFESGNADSLVCALETVLYDEKLCKDLVSKGFERLKFFSWKKTAMSTKRVYMDLVS
jgi:glycosyltransferase involved in cell wall biosynthesis